MKKLLLTLACISLPLLAGAQLKKVDISSATCTQSQSGEDASRAIDGNVGTLWHSPYSGTKFPVNFIIKFNKTTHVDMVRYVPRTNGANGNWKEVEVFYNNRSTPSGWEELGTYNLGGSGSSYDFELGEEGLDVRHIRFSIKSGAANFASAAEIEAYIYDNTKQEAFQTYFSDDLFTELKPEVTTAEGIEDADVKVLVGSLLSDAQGYKKFRVGEYEPYRTTASLQSELKTSSQYNQFENPTGIYLKAGEECYVAVSGITTEKVGLKIKNWVDNEDESSMGLRNGLNKITAATEGNVFVNYYTDNYQTAPNVKVHFINGPVRGYWDQETMTNDDWKKMLAPLPNDNSIIIVRTKHAQMAYPVKLWKSYCPVNVDSVATLYQQAQWAQRDIMGLEKYGRQTKNRQLFYATNYGFMAAGGTGAYCHVGSLKALMTPDSKVFDFWGVGHEWGHNNQIAGFKWSGCGETTNNIYASWAQIHFSGNNTSNLRLEDERSGVGEYSGMRGGRMQTYFEEGLRKGVQWQLQDGPDYHGATPNTITVMDYDYDGKAIGTTTTTSRNYDHFVKLSPFWQLNLWGTLAGKCPDIIPMIIESIRQTDGYTNKFNTNGKLQVNWMKLACDSAGIDLLPFFEKAGMLRPINAYIEDYGAGWNKISQSMINELKTYVAGKGYPAFSEEINYINGHNYHIYRDNLKLSVPSKLGTGCTYGKGFVKVLHSQVKNAVAYETYNSAGELIRITMYGLGSDDQHSFTQVLYPAGTTDNIAEAAAYIMAVGYDGTRQKIYEEQHIQKTIDATKFYTLTSKGKGKTLSCGTGTTISTDGTIDWKMARTTKSAAMDRIWYFQKDGDKTYALNPQSGCYLPFTPSTAFSNLVPKDQAATFTILSVDETAQTYTLEANGSGQYLNAYNDVNTGYYGGGSSDANNIWIVEEVTSININIPTSGYYTATYPVNLDIPDGVSAYTVAETQQLAYGEETFDYAVLDQLPTTYIPANTPVILVGEKGSYSFALRNYEADAPTVQNLLHGVTLKVTGLESYTVMFNVTANSNQVAGTDAYMKTVGASTVSANRAYLLKGEVNATQVYLQTRENLPTGITDVKGDTANAVLYDLSGTRITKPQSGRVYVTSNGAKVLLK